MDGMSYDGSTSFTGQPSVGANRRLHGILAIDCRGRSASVYICTQVQPCSMLREGSKDAVYCAGKQLDQPYQPGSCRFESGMRMRMEATILLNRGKCAESRVQVRSVCV